MRQKPLPSPFATALASVAAFALAGLVEFGWLALTGAVEAPPAQLARLAGHFVGLGGTFGACVGLLLAIIVPPLVAITRPGRWLKTHVSPGGSDQTPAAALNRAAAWGLAALVTLGPIGLVAAAGGYLAHGFNQRMLATAFVGLVAVGALGVGLLVLFPLRAAFGWVFRSIAPDGRLFGLPTPALPILTVLAVGVACALRIAQIDLGAYKLGGYFAVAAAVLLSLILLGLWRGRGPFRAGPAAVVTLALVLGLGGWTIVSLERTPIAPRVLALDAHLGRVALQSFRAALDFDGDGASELLAGGDCAEGDPAIGPHARDIPGNGIDENCQGGDAQPEAPPPPPPPPEPDEPRYEAQKLNVVFVLIDTLRPDHLGLYGYARETSPNIDAWAKDAVVFEKVFAHAPNTPRSTPSILIGRYPSRIAWDKRYKNYSDLKPENESIFEIFQAGGWRTEAISAHWYFERAPGIKDGVDLWDNRGFLTIKESNTQSAAPDLTPRVVERLGALAGGEQPFFLFVHYFDPHGRYMQQKSVRTFGKKLMDKYDSEIAFVDHHLQPVFDALAEHGLYENTAVVLTSDHGEAFKEHGFYFHGRTIYDEEIRVPLLIRAPGAEPKRVERPVALVDLVPTLAEMVGLKAEKAMGHSLIPLLYGIGEMAERLIFMEQLPYPNYKAHIVGAVSPEGIKVIRNVTDNVTEIYDLNADPGEKTNLLDADPEAHEALRDRLLQFIDADPGG